MKDISLTIPTKNEEEQIIGTIENYKKILKSIYNEKYEIIIVCNNCTDQTPEIVKKYIKKNKGPIKLIIKPKTAGKGEAILIGWAHANAKYLGFVDSDDQFNNEDIKNMLKNLTKNDCTIASKWKHSSFKNVK